MSPANRASEAATPNYRVIAEGLLGLIERGEVGPGERLPTYAALMDTYGVSRPTVLQAYRVLIDLGKVVNMGRAGHFVQLTIPRHWVLARAGRYADPWECLEAEGTKREEVHIEIPSSELPIQGKPLGEWFGRAEEELISRTSVRTLDDSPIQLVMSFLPLTLAGGTDLRRPKSLGMTPAEFLVRECREELVGVTDTVTARPATEREARLLELPEEAATVLEVVRQVRFSPGDVVLLVEKIVVDGNGGHFVADRRDIASQMATAGS